MFWALHWPFQAFFTSTNSPFLVVVLTLTLSLPLARGEWVAAAVRGLAQLLLSMPTSQSPQEKTCVCILKKKKLKAPFLLLLLGLFFQHTRMLCLYCECIHICSIVILLYMCRVGRRKASVQYRVPQYLNYLVMPKVHFQKNLSNQIFEFWRLLNNLTHRFVNISLKYLKYVSWPVFWKYTNSHFSTLYRIAKSTHIYNLENNYILDYFKICPDHLFKRDQIWKFWFIWVCI